MDNPGEAIKTNDNTNTFTIARSIGVGVNIDWPTAQQRCTEMEMKHVNPLKAQVVHISCVVFFGWYEIYSYDGVCSQDPWDK